MRYPKYVINSLNDIYNNIYINIMSRDITCFLCGKASDSTDPAKRDILRDELESNTHFPKIKILYAEELFRSIVSIRSKDNLLSLENILAESADSIVIILESAGAFVELGAFSNIEDLSKKMIVLMDDKYRRDESFINLGPLKKIKQHEKSKVVYYKSEIDSATVSKTEKAIKALKDSSSVDYNIKSLVSLIFFTELLIYFFSPVSFDELAYLAEQLEVDIQTSDPAFKSKLRACLQYLLLTEKSVVKKKSKFYTLTPEGFEKLSNSFKKSKSSVIDTTSIDKIRISVLDYKLRKEKEQFKEFYC